MEFVFYILLLIINVNYFVKFFLLLMFFIFFVICILIYFKYRFFNLYYKEVINFNKEFNDKNIDLKEFYNKLLVKKTYIIGLSVIFFSGFKEFIYLHRKGISDVVTVAKMVQCVMNISKTREISKLYNSVVILLFIKNFILFFCIIGFIFGFIIFIQLLNFNLYQNISFFYVFSVFIESLFILIEVLFLFFLINIFYIRYLSIIKNISNNYKIFINEFVILLYHKLYN